MNIIMAKTGSTAKVNSAKWHIFSNPPKYLPAKISGHMVYAGLLEQAAISCSTSRVSNDYSNRGPRAWIWIQFGHSTIGTLHQCLLQTRIVWLWIALEELRKLRAQPLHMLLLHLLIVRLPFLLSCPLAHFWLQFIPAICDQLSVCP